MPWSSDSPHFNFWKMLSTLTHWIWLNHFQSCIRILDRNPRICMYIFISVQFSCSVVSNYLKNPWIAARQASLSITNSRSSLRLTSIESVMPFSHLILWRPFSSCPQSLPASEAFPMSQLFAWGGQSTGVSDSASFPPKKSQD